MAQTRMSARKAMAAMEARNNAPHYTQQRRYIYAFTEYILTPRNKMVTGKSCKPRWVVECLWTLWPECPREPGLYAYFVRNFKPRIQLVRMASAPERFNNALLFELVKRFLAAHDIVVVGPEDMQSVVDAIRTAPALLAPRNGMHRRMKATQGINVYAVSTADRDLGKFYEAPDVYRYLAFYVQENALAVSCPALAFDTHCRELHFGAYYFHSRYAYLRNFHIQPTSYYTYWLDWGIFANSSVTEPIGGSGVDVVCRLMSTRAPYDRDSEEYCYAELTRICDPILVSHAEAYFKQFDV